MALTLAKNYRHPGAGRDPECLMVTVLLDSGLRRNDEKKLKFVLSKRHSSLIL
ncbi:MAG: hypothetical protein ABW094_19750 [Candidatus Thiodiazotropha sp.]